MTPLLQRSSSGILILYLIAFSPTFEGIYNILFRFESSTADGCCRWWWWLVRSEGGLSSLRNLRRNVSVTKVGSLPLVLYQSECLPPCPTLYRWRQITIFKLLSFPMAAEHQPAAVMHSNFLLFIFYFLYSSSFKRYKLTTVCPWSLEFLNFDVDTFWELLSFQLQMPKKVSKIEDLRLLGCWRRFPAPRRDKAVCSSCAFLRRARPWRRQPGDSSRQEPTKIYGSESFHMLH